MAKVTVKALDSFHHGRLNAVRDAIYTMSKGEADDLKKAGLVEEVGDAADDDVDDLVGGAKMEPITSNKMEAKPENKAAKK